MTTGTNDFLPIATAGGAVVDDQTDYAAATPAAGLAFGIVPQGLLNKMLRQSSSMAAMIGLFIANAGFDAIDDGDIPALETAFEDALGGSGYVKLTDFTGSGKQLLAGDGYQVFPGGWIVQWVHGTVSGGGSTTVAWPIAFPNSCFGAVISSNDTFKPTTPAGIISTTLSNCVIDCESSSDTPSCFIIALGK